MDSNNIPNERNLFNQLVETRTGKSIALAIATIAIASACSNNPEVASGVASETATIAVEEGTEPTNSSTEAAPGLISLEAGELLTDEERVAACRELLPSYGYVPNVHLEPDASAEKILALRLAVMSDAYESGDARLLWCAYPIDHSSYVEDRDNLLSGVKANLPVGWNSLEETSRDDSGEVDLVWSFDTMQGPTVVQYGHFKYVNGIFLNTELRSEVIENE